MPEVVDAPLVLVGQHKTMTLAAANALCLPVASRAGQPIGRLLPIGPWLLDDQPQIDAISAWRQRAMRMFLAQFQATPQNTRAYLRDLSIGQPDRLLWLILDADGRRIGHVGLSGITGGPPGRAELDNLMRGIDGGHPGLVQAAEVALLHWAFCRLGLQQVDVRVVSYNWMVIALHEEVGFETTEQRPLFKRMADGVVFHDECPPDQANVRYHCTHMRLTRDRFFQQGALSSASN